MRKVYFLFFPVLFLVFLVTISMSEAQSTLEYATLMGAAGGAAAKATAKKNDSQGDQGAQDSQGASSEGVVTQGMNQVYGQAGGALSKGAAMLGQLGGGAPAPVATAPGAAPVPEAQPPAPTASATETPLNSLVKLTLKTGQVIEGKLVEKNKDYIKIDSAGVTVTYFSEEITKIEKSFQ